MSDASERALALMDTLPPKLRAVRVEALTVAIEAAVAEALEDEAREVSLASVVAASVAERDADRAATVAAVADDLTKLMADREQLRTRVAHLEEDVDHAGKEARRQCGRANTAEARVAELEAAVRERRRENEVNVTALRQMERERDEARANGILRAGELLDMAEKAEADRDQLKADVKELRRLLNQNAGYLTDATYRQQQAEDREAKALEGACERVRAYAEAGCKAGRRYPIDLDAILAAIMGEPKEDET